MNWDTNEEERPPRPATPPHRLRHPFPPLDPFQRSESLNFETLTFNEAECLTIGQSDSEMDEDDTVRVESRNEPVAASAQSIHHFSFVWTCSKRYRFPQSILSDVRFVWRRHRYIAFEEPSLQQALEKSSSVAMIWCGERWVGLCNFGGQNLPK